MTNEEIKRGDIYYVYPVDFNGSEQGGGRPAIVVSNDIGNHYAPIVSVVFLTTQKKKNLPTHAAIKSSARDSIALCEQVSNVSKERLGAYIASCSNDEMQEVDRAVAIALGLRSKDGNIDHPFTESSAETAESITVRAELNVYKRLYDNLLQTLMK